MRTAALLLAAATAQAGILPLPSGPIGAPCFANDTALELFSDMNLTGKVAVVTGSDRGIGLEIARALAAKHATVVLAWRNLTHIKEDSAAYIYKTVPYADLYIPSHPLDLSDFASVRGYVQSIQKFKEVHYLINDAAMDNNPHGLVTKQGMEMAFEIDYPSQWLLTQLLMPQLRRGKGRIVSLVSKAYRLACQMSLRKHCMDLDRLPPPVINTSGLPDGKIPIFKIPATNYGIAKLLVIRWTEDLARREAAAGTGVTAYSVDPGFVNTSMAKSGNLSPEWLALSCHSEGRKGAPCPTTPEMGALTPVFLALAPGIESTSGKYYEWCAPADVKMCMDGQSKWTPGKWCGGSSQEYKDGLWNLTAQWVANYSAPIEPASTAVAPVDEELSFCPLPKLLQPLCSVVSSAGCVLKCMPQILKCTADKNCSKALESASLCAAKMMKAKASSTEMLSCFVPDDWLRDNVFYCMMDEHDCLPAGKDNTTYPACREASIPGDAGYAPQHFYGHWWKVQGWTSGEVYECRPCAEVSFWNYTAPLRWPNPTPPTGDYNVMSSTWLEKDSKGQQFIMNDTSMFGPRPGKIGYPEREQHIGVMYGLSYQENFTVVHDGTAEKEPFAFFYGCGETKQGAYVTGFVIARTPTASPTLKARIADVATKNGFDPAQWCDVDNSCSAAR
eukprot:TRINITY_DN27_c0_g1_i2.p1 TRINITY_DN27_c0_g1~~TRINITY_DN27_c0_g1_i2.p1  ORF type:complete len:672 (+),score=268.69 TRINITY_DN27_c0_g1_i2:70-2085(+)